MLQSGVQRLTVFPFTFHFHSLMDWKMATHARVSALEKSPGTGRHLSNCHLSGQARSAEGTGRSSGYDLAFFF